jgi:uncharacterized lipoprotein YmbA
MKTLSRLLAVTALLGLVGCNVLPEPKSDAVRYFTLSTAAPTQGTFDGPTVRPVQLAGHLRNRAMAVRIAENEVIYLEDVRWAESLADAVTQLLRTRLAASASSAIVNVQIQRCELLRFQGNSVQFAATYTILASGENAAPKHGAFTASARTWDGSDYGMLVNQLRDAIGELGDAIAGALPEKK